ncbi:hypothetical protein H6G33_30335 [Calothrix sp. FACHB-1219]|nr:MULTISPECIES: hypothetical protein [unclassified Calothrix]MBD2204101.1 hypothetical protein [Calothrix sp. FACHB-168]MBD2221274.1 hypothetical protein [Calothrix sp. FACHB-1219]
MHYFSCVSPVGRVEGRENQQLQEFGVLGFVPQPNLHALHPLIKHKA